MTESTSLHLGADARIRLPDVDEALDVAYAHHGSRDPELAGTLSQELCIRILKKFMALEPTPNTAEGAYISAVQSIVHSHGRALTRRKQQYHADCKAAYEERDRRWAQIRGARWNSGIIAFAGKLLGPIVLWLLGYLIALIIGPSIPDNVTEQTGTDAPAYFMGFVFILIARYISIWMYDRRHDRIVQECNSRLYIAFQTYELGKLREFKLWRQRLCEEWKQYTGEEYPERASYQMIMQADIEARRKLEEHLFLHNKTDIERLQEIVRWLIDACLKPVRRKNKASVQEAKAE